MSRNIRQKYPAKSARAPSRPRPRRDSDSSLSLDLSDDSGYSGVDDVTDSDDDDEEHVVAAEEEHIISDALRKRSSAPPRPLDDEEDDADEESEADDDNDVLPDDAHDDDADSGDDSASWEGFPSDSDDAGPGAPFADDLLDEVAAPVERHVRFAGVPDSDSDSTTTETSDVNDFFPDIFVEQSALDPSFRREIENDDETSSNSSFWDFYSGSHEFKTHDVGDVEDPAEDSATPRPSVPPADVVTPIASRTTDMQELDGYETDGDTTEEDTPEPIIRKKQQARRAHTVEPSSDSETERPTPRRPGKPRVGRFNLDRSDNKPIGVVDPATGKMIIFTPRRTNQLDLSPESLHVDFSAPDMSSPLVRNPGLVMMGAMVSSNTFGDFMNMQPMGPTEAFFPYNSDPFGLADDDSDDSYFGVEEDEEESMLRIEDFVTFGDDSSDEESGVEWNDNLTSSPTRPRTSGSSASAATESANVHPLLSHFDGNSDVVGAFRRNQIHQQLIYSHKASQESLSFSAPYHFGTLRGIKKGRMESVTAPITPIRRHKRSNTITGLSTTPGAPQSSPLSAASQKRKASGNPSDAAHAHKRHRSISDMEVLKI